MQLPDSWLTAGVLFQAVWNGITGRAPGTGVRDADIFYFDPDTSWAAEDAVINRAARVFDGVGIPVEVRNEARVHLWYAERFGAPAPRPFTGCRDAIDHFAAICCCVGVTVVDGKPEVYAPHGFTDLFDLVIRLCSTSSSVPTRCARRSTSTSRRRPAGRRSGRNSPCCPGRPERDVTGAGPPDMAGAAIE